MNDQDMFNPCAIPNVTIGFLEELAGQDASFQNEDGTPNLPACLFKLGFKIKQNARGKWHGWETYKNRLVRAKEAPYKVYRTTVFSGILRNEVIGVTEGGFIYGKRKHKIGNLYNRVGILNSSSFKGDHHNIQEVGTKHAYNGN